MIDSKKKKVVAFYQSRRRMPTYQELTGIMGVASKNAVSRAVSNWIEEGFVEKDETRHLIPGPMVYRIRLLGIVEAGFPTPAEEDNLDTLSLDEFLIDHKESSYMLRVKGDSMIEAGINEGDYVIVERTENSKVGEIVIAEVDGGWTMKYLRKNAEGYYLEPANKKYKPIYPTEDMKIAAKVKAVVRKY